MTAPERRMTGGIVGGPPGPSIPPVAVRLGRRTTMGYSSRFARPWPGGSLEHVAAPSGSDRLPRLPRRFRSRDFQRARLAPARGALQNRFPARDWPAGPAAPPCVGSSRSRGSAVSDPHRSPSRRVARSTRARDWDHPVWPIRRCRRAREPGRWDSRLAHAIRQRSTIPRDRLQRGAGALPVQPDDAKRRESVVPRCVEREAVVVAKQLTDAIIDGQVDDFE